MADIPASHSRPLDGAAMAITVLLCVTWGFNQVAIKLALADIPPLIQCTLRTAFATVIVLALMRARGLPITARDGTLIPGLIAGALFGLEFLLIYRGLIYTTASRATLFIYLAPFFVVIGARLFLPGDRFWPLQWAGLVMSFAGMLIAFGVPTPAADPRQDVILFGAALCRNDLHDRLAHHFAGVVTKQTLGAAIPARDQARHVLAEDRVFGGLGERREKRPLVVGPDACTACSCTVTSRAWSRCGERFATGSTGWV